MSVKTKAVTTTIVTLTCDSCGAMHEVSEHNLSTADLPWVHVKLERPNGWLLGSFDFCPTCIETQEMDNEPSVWQLIDKVKWEGPCEEVKVRLRPVYDETGALTDPGDSDPDVDGLASEAEREELTGAYEKGFLGEHPEL